MVCNGPLSDLRLGNGCVVIIPGYGSTVLKQRSLLSEQIIGTFFGFVGLCVMDSLIAPAPSPLPTSHPFPMVSGNEKMRGQNLL